MNFVQDMAMKGMKDQMNQFLPKEEPKELQNKDSNNLDVKAPKKSTKKKKKIDRSLAVKMFTVLFLHTTIITVLLFVGHYKYLDEINKRTENIGEKNNWFIFYGCIIVSIILSLLVCYVNFVSRIFLNYLFYIVLLVLNTVAFVYGGKDNSAAFEYTSSMLIMFNMGSLSILLMSCSVRENPSTFWMMLAAGAGLLLTLMVMCKVYNDHKYMTFLFCSLAFAIYESTTYNALDCFEHPEKRKNVPSMMTLPFELNLNFIKILYYILLFIIELCKGCCCSNKRK